MTHYCSNFLCLSKNNIPATIVYYSGDCCIVIGCAPVFSPHGLFLYYNLWECKKNQDWRRCWRVCCKINPGLFDSHRSLSSGTASCCRNNWMILWFMRIWREKFDSPNTYRTLTTSTSESCDYVNRWICY